MEVVYDSIKSDYLIPAFVNRNIKSKQEFGFEFSCDPEFTKEKEVEVGKFYPGSPISAFENELGRVYKTSVINNYELFLESRLNYLEGLKNIGDNWISGGSKQPSIQSIEKTKGILNIIIQKLSSNYRPFPKILLSPIPKGGISLLIKFTENSSILFSINDDENVEIEFELNGSYDEIEEVDTSVISGYFSDYLKEYDSNT